MGEGGGRWLVKDSSEWVDELQLLVSEGSSLGVQGGNDDTSSTERGGGGGGGGGRGGGRGRTAGGAGRHGWKPLHLGSPFVSRADAFRLSNLSNDFVLQRFFYRKNKTQKKKMMNRTFKESKDTFNTVKPY